MGSNIQLLSAKMAQHLHVNGRQRQFGLDQSKPVPSPMVESFFTVRDVEEDKSSYEIQMYQQMMGSLLYLALRTGGDNLPPVIISARFQKAPTRYGHLTVKTVLRCLHGTTRHGLFFQHGDMLLNCFVHRILPASQPIGSQ